MTPKAKLRIAAATLAIGAALGLAQPGGVDPFDGSRAGAEREIEGVKLCWAPPGRFRMGSPSAETDRRSDEGPVEVTLSRGFWVGKYEVTQGQWTRIAGAFIRQMDKGLGDDIPMYWVNYPEAEGFCRKLTERAWASGQLPKNWEFRLPTEAQWEYACRAETATATSFGNTLSSKQANIDGAKPYNGGEAGPYLRQSVKAGSYPANRWGLHDMHGSVWEWCRDWYHATLPGGVDPEATVKGVPNRDGTYSLVRRSGAWIESGADSRSARRLRYEPDRRSDHIGFRVVAVRR